MNVKMLYLPLSHFSIKNIYGLINPEEFVNVVCNYYDNKEFIAKYIYPNPHCVSFKKRYTRTVHENIMKNYKHLLPLIIENITKGYCYNNPVNPQKLSPIYKAFMSRITDEDKNLIGDVIYNHMIKLWELKQFRRNATDKSLYVVS